MVADAELGMISGGREVVVEKAYRVVAYCVEELHVEAVAEGVWTALLQEVEEALYVVEEAVAAGYAYEDLCLV